ncbi:hypothetical protein OE88DRAFT_199433 [Heliocybe sulcata]|uniref:Uncharacterized protein n=1 Tax=Heliocybe sulcata TaxID=5364 RepID=A0A5C3N0G9_9AGAM|nr:hypothetical protein OE88DRAFT_199433 [Heliocybe sulcata]
MLFNPSTHLIRLLMHGMLHLKDNRCSRQGLVDPLPARLLLHSAWTSPYRSLMSWQDHAKLIVLECFLMNLHGAFTMSCADRRVRGRQDCFSSAYSSVFPAAETYFFHFTAVEFVLSLRRLLFAPCSVPGSAVGSHIIVTSHRANRHTGRAAFAPAQRSFTTTTLCSACPICCLRRRSLSFLA